MCLYAAVALAIVVILSGVLFAYTFAALRARRLFRSPFALRWLIAYRARRWAARLWSLSPDDAWLASKPARGECIGECDRHRFVGSEERRVGKECVCTCKSRGSP